MVSNSANLVLSLLEVSPSRLKSRSTHDKTDHFATKNMHAGVMCLYRVKKWNTDTLKKSEQEHLKEGKSQVMCMSVQQLA